MSLSSETVFGITTISFVVATLVSFLIYRATIGKWYSNERHYSLIAKIKYWCGVISLVALAQGMTTIFNSLAVSLIGNTEINFNSIAKGGVAVFVFPIFFMSIALVSSFLIKDKNKPSDVDVTPNEGDNTASQNGHKSIVAVLSLIVIVLLGLQLKPNWLADEKQKTFFIESCNFCGKDGCKPSISFTKFVVTPPFIDLYHLSEGLEKITSYPDDAEMNCEIRKDRNFAFECNKNEYYGAGISRRISIVFDGKNTYQSNLVAKFGEAGTVSSKESCLIK